MTPSAKQLTCLALASFAIGTEGYVVAGLLPSLAADLNVSVPVAGQLISVFALVYAVASPILAVATATTERRKLLITAITVFGLFNLVAASAHSYTALMAARIGLALSAAAFMPAAAAYAVAVTRPERRARALAVIFAGLTVATVVGVPIGVLAGHAFGWRFTFTAVAGLSFFAMIGLARTLKRLHGDPSVTLSERLSIARQPDMLRALGVTVTVLAGAFSIYSYLTPFLQQTSGLGENAIAAVLFLFGLGSAVGNFSSGALTDRYGGDRVVRTVLFTLTVVFTALALSGQFLHGETARWVIIPLIGIWGFVGWSFPAAQQSRIVALAPRLAPVSLSLNSSAIYLGVSSGAFLGSLVGAQGSFAGVPWIGVVCEMAALTILMAFPVRRAPANSTDAARPIPTAAAAPELQVSSSIEL